MKISFISSQGLAQEQVNSYIDPNLGFAGQWSPVDKDISTLTFYRESIKYYTVYSRLDRKGSEGGRGEQ